MLQAIAVISSLALIGWIIYRAARKRAIRAHFIMYGLASIGGIITLAFFLSMDIARIVKVIICIVLGAALIFLAAYLQRRRQPRRS
jgi:hypothetical protein